MIVDSMCWMFVEFSAVGTPAFGLCVSERCGTLKGLALQAYWELYLLCTGASNFLAAGHLNGA